MVWGVLVLAGAALGILFYGGLWITVRRLPQIHRPALWMTTSFILRMAGVVGGFYLLMAGDWRRLAALLLGFVPVRLGLLKCLDTHSLPTVSTDQQAEKHGNAHASLAKTISEQSLRQLSDREENP
ncbi:MAG: hypothetical protein Kow0060_07410 [Methylohalobius crimeensis]